MTDVPTDNSSPAWTAPNPAIAAVMALALGCVALWLRLPGFDGRAFWIDELWRVNLFLTDDPIQTYLQHPDSQTGITSPIYLALNKAITQFSLSPQVLRLPSLLAGLGSVALSFAAMHRAGAGLIVSTLIALVFAANPLFIRYSNELKPYIVEILMHLTCLFCWLGVVLATSPGRSDLVRLFAVLGVAVVFAPNVVFVLPSYVITVLWVIRHQSTLWRTFGIGLAVIGLLVGACHLMIWRYGADAGMMEFWANGFWSGGAQRYPAWLWSRLIEMIDATFTLGTGYKPSRKYWLIIFFVMAGMLLLRDRRINRDLLRLTTLFLGIFVATLAALNGLGWWPLGALRPNLFAYAIFASGMGLLFACFARITLLRTLYGVGLAFAMFGLANTNTDALHLYSSPLEEHDKVWEDFRADAPAGRQILGDCARGVSVKVLVTSSMNWARIFHERQDAMERRPPSALAGPCVTFIPVPDGPAALSQAIESARGPADGHNPDIWVLYSFVARDGAAALRESAAKLGRIDASAEYDHAGYFRIGGLPGSASLISTPSESSQTTLAPRPEANSSKISCQAGSRDLLNRI